MVEEWIDRIIVEVQLKEEQHLNVNIILTKRYNQCENQVFYQKQADLAHHTTRQLTKSKEEFKLATSSLGCGITWKLTILSE